MSEAEQSRSYIGILRNAIDEDLLLVSSSLRENKERWRTVSESIASIADALYSDDVEGRRSFINVVLGIEVKEEIEQDNNS